MVKESTEKSLGCHMVLLTNKFASMLRTILVYGDLSKCNDVPHLIKQNASVTFDNLMKYSFFSLLNSRI